MKQIMNDIGSTKPNFLLMVYMHLFGEQDVVKKIESEGITALKPVLPSSQ